MRTGPGVPLGHAIDTTQDGSCSLTVVAPPIPTTTSDGYEDVRVSVTTAGTCTIQVVPSGGDRRGTLQIRLSGQCTGIELSLSVRPQVNSLRTASTRSVSGSARGWCKITGKDIIGLDMFWNRSELSWDYVNLSVSNPRHYRGQYTNSNWDLLDSLASVLSDGGTQFEAYDYAHWYSDGFPTSAFPDVEAWSQPTVYARGRGTWFCDYWVRTGRGWDLYALVFNYAMDGTS